MALGANLIAGRPLVPTPAARRLNLQGSQIAFVNDKLLPSQEDSRANTLLPSWDKRILQHAQYQGNETGSRTLQIGKVFGRVTSWDEVRLKAKAERWKKFRKILGPREVTYEVVGGLPSLGNIPR